MRIKPTKRKDGMFRCTHHIAVHIDIFDIINAMIYYNSISTDELPSNRQAAMKLALRHCAESGHNAWATVAERADDVGAACAVRAVQLFPDLAQGIDLSGYGVGRVVESQEGASVPAG